MNTKLNLKFLNGDNGTGDTTRMPIWQSQDTIRRQWLYPLVMADASYALFTMFGKSEGAAQVLLRQTLPSWLWPCMLFASAMLILFGVNIPGSGWGAMVWVALVASVLTTLYRGTGLSGAGWILPAYIGWQHILILWQVRTGIDSDRERRQRRG